MNLNMLNLLIRSIPKPNGQSYKTTHINTFVQKIFSNHSFLNLMSVYQLPKGNNSDNVRNIYKCLEYLYFVGFV